MRAHQTHPVNIEQICSFGAWWYGDYTGYVEQSWIKRLGLCWTIVARNAGAKVKEEVGNDAGDICYSSFWSPALPTMAGPDSFRSLSPSPLISTQPVFARQWRRLEDGGKIGRLIEIIMWCTSVTVVSSAPQCLSRAGRCARFHRLVPIASGRSRQLKIMYGISCFQNSAPKCWFILICFGSELCVLSFFCFAIWYGLSTH